MGDVALQRVVMSAIHFAHAAAADALEDPVVTEPCTEGHHTSGRPKHRPRIQRVVSRADSRSAARARIAAPIPHDRRQGLSPKIAMRSSL